MDENSTLAGNSKWLSGKLNTIFGSQARLSPATQMELLLGCRVSIVHFGV